LSVIWANETFKDMGTVREIVAALEEFAPAALQMAYDNTGLQVGRPEQEVRSVLLAVDVTPAVLQEALERGADMIVAHHPLIFNALKSITGRNATEQIVALAIKRDVAIYAGHTSVDAVCGGVSWRLGAKLGLQAMQTLEPVAPPLGDSACCGFGVVGDLSVPVSEQDFLQRIKEVCGTPVLRHTALRGVPVRRAAVCGGSGSSLIPLAVRAGAEVYVSADFKYHDFAAASGSLLAVDAGHFETEQFTKELFYEVLTKKFPNFAVCFSQVNTNPINYS
jgi:dinuclear metal center YbgI/SA1388 family protein